MAGENASYCDIEGPDLEAIPIIEMPKIETAVSEEVPITEDFNASKHAQKLAELFYSEKDDYLKARKWWRRGIGTMMFITAAVHLFGCIRSFILFPNETSIIWLTSSLSIEILGLSAIVLNHLFPKYNKG